MCARVYTQVTHPELSPLVLCDGCTRSYHMACLGLEWAELPDGDWECPKCADRKDAAVRRLLDFEMRKVEAFERCVGVCSWGSLGVCGLLCERVGLWGWWGCGDGGLP